MRKVLLAAALLFSTAAFAKPDCLTCRHNLQKALEACKSESGASRDVCRESAYRDGKKCEEEHVGGDARNLDLLMTLPSPLLPLQNHERAAVQQQAPRDV